MESSLFLHLITIPRRALVYTLAAFGDWIQGARALRDPPPCTACPLLALSCRACARRHTYMRCTGSTTSASGRSGGSSSSATPLARPWARCSRPRGTATGTSSTSSSMASSTPRSGHRAPGPGGRPHRPPSPLRPRSATAPTPHPPRAARSPPARSRHGPPPAAAAGVPGEPLTQAGSAAGRAGAGGGGLLAAVHVV